MSRRLWAQEQNSLKKQLVYADSFSWSAPGTGNEDQPQDQPQKLRYVGGLDLSFVKEDPTIACAALVVVDAETLEPVYEDFELTTLNMPYIPGFLAFREAPALLLLLHRMAARAPDRFPQLLLVDGNGILHPRGFGLASHLGVLADVPTIGVAKTLFQVDGLDERTEKQAAHRLLTRGGDWRPLTGMSGRVWGAALRSTNESRNPVFVSVGHRISLATAVAVTAKLCKFRVPEPVRLADKKSREFLQLQGYTESRTGVR